MDRLPHLVDLGLDAPDILGCVVNRDESVFSVLAFDEINAESGNLVFWSDTGRIEVGEDLVEEKLAEILAIRIGSISLYFVKALRTSGFVIDKIDFVRIRNDIFYLVDLPRDRYLIIEEDIARSEIVLEFGGETEIICMEGIPSTESDESFLTETIRLVWREDLTRDGSRECLFEERERWNLRIFLVLEIKHLKGFVVDFPEDGKFIVLEWIAKNRVSEESLGIIEEGIEIRWRDAIGFEEFLNIEPFLVFERIDPDGTLGFIEDKFVQIRNLSDRTI